ncbi:MAG: hypothetical protein Q9209_000596 [Squamulea sp. 1 TL-2023]
MNGGEQSGGGLFVTSGGFEPSPPPDNGLGYVVSTSSPVPDFVASGSYPQDSGSGSIAGPNKLPYANNTGYQVPSFPGGTSSDQSAAAPDQPAPSIDRSPDTSLPLDIGGYGSATSSEQDYGGLPPYITSNVVPPLETGAVYGNGRSDDPIPSNPTNAGSYGMPPFSNLISVQATEVPYQPASGTAPTVNGGTDYIGSDVCGNGGCKSLQEYCSAVKRNGQSDARCDSEQLPPLTTSSPKYQPPPQGNGGVDYIGSDPCGNGGCKNLQEYCSAVSRNGQSDPRCDSELSPPPTTSLPPYETLSSTGLIYTTMVKEVVPYPVEPAIESSSTRRITSIEIYNNNPPMPTGGTSAAQGDAGGLSEGLSLTSATTSDDNPIPASSPIPPPSSDNTTAIDPSCIPSPENQSIQVNVSPPPSVCYLSHPNIKPNPHHQFNRLTPGLPVPSPYESLLYIGFEFSASSTSSTSYLTSPASAIAKSIAIAPPVKHFNLTSFSLACSVPPCTVTIWGTKVASKTAQGAAAGTLLNSRTTVDAKMDGEGAFTVVDGLEAKGWTEMEKVSFVVEEKGVGIAVDDLSYAVRVEGGCEGEKGNGKAKEGTGEEGKEEEGKDEGPEEVGIEMSGLGKPHRERIRKL